MKPSARWWGALTLAATIAAACSTERPSPTEPQTSTQKKFVAHCLPACVFTTVIEAPGPVTVAPNTSHSSQFDVRNSGNSSGTTGITCTGKFGITCGTVTPSSVHLNPGQAVNVTVNWTAGVAGLSTGRLILKATVGGGGDTQMITIQ